ncbi:Intercellular adhesion molecule 1 [Tupaia chinensis]|uniref:Intercellular adhesion molecule 1 n=1 Tax=Tupaia chinensis TaxID=246437 RepID=L8YCB9_TUPCH|nr:Intercellular adhesion molecule 1 [Tupaia chinensis]
MLFLLHPFVPGPGDAQTLVFPQKAILPRGGSIQLNCSAICNVTALLGLETPQPKNELDKGPNWKVFELNDVSEDTTPLCFSNCGTNQSNAQASLTVYWFPERVELQPLPPWQPVGENLTLRCLVEGGAPRAHLAVVLVRGEEELSRQPAIGEPAEVTATVLAGRGDHGANFSCRTELDLRSQGLELFQNTSAPRQLRTFALPATGPHLATPLVVEVGTPWTVVCSLDGVFPASDAQVSLTLRDLRLNSTVTRRKDTLSARASGMVTAEEEGTQSLACTVTVGNQRRAMQKNVTFYSFQEPSLTLSQPEVSEGTEVIVECKAQPGAVVTLSGAPARTPSSSDQLRVNATAEDNGRRFSCSAALEVAGQVLHKNQTRELRVLYGPRLDERDCPGNWTWQEGTPQTLKCQARGNPPPQLNCRRKGDGALLRIGDLGLVTRDLTGTYICRAQNALGEATREVSVNVLYQDNTLLIAMLVVAAVVLGIAGVSVYLYNRQRKIKKYRLQKAQEAATMKLTKQATQA